MPNEKMAAEKMNVTTTMPKDLVLRIDQEADKRRMVRSHFIEALVREGLERLKPVDELRLTQ